MDSSFMAGRRKAKYVGLTTGSMYFGAGRMISFSLWEENDVIS
jgi:hypothetical protein